MPSLATKFGRNRTEFRSDQPLSDDTIRHYAPSIFAESAHESRSERYAFIPTSEVLRGLRSEGFEPFMVAQCKTRDPGMREYTKHLVRLRHPDQVAKRDEANEILLLNSHGGASSFQLLAGNFRFACANGLIVGNETADVRIQHKGDVGHEVIEGAFRVLKSFEDTNAQVEAMKSLTLNRDEQVAFGAAALALRYDEGRAPITAERIIEPRRRADVGSDLWSVFNRAQENAIRGEQSGRSQTTNRNVSTRPVTGLDSNVKLNRALWVLAEEMGRLKTAA